MNTSNTSSSSTKKVFLDVLLYLVLYLAIQVVVTMVGGAIFSGNQSSIISIGESIISGALTVALFVWRNWSPFSREYIQTRPWGLLFWVVCLALGTIAPLQLMQEGIGIEMPEKYQKLFEELMKSDWGFFAAAIMAPVVEEVVFRGAILRRLLQCQSLKGHWMAIFITSLAFAAVHANLSQGVNALLIGLVLGWLYYRTNSIVPGMAMHITINTCAVIISRLTPTATTCSQLLGNSPVRITLAVVFSLAIFVAALYQVLRELKK